MNDFRKYIPFSKVESNDDGTVTVHGVMTSEAVDHDEEVIDYDASKRAIFKKGGYNEWRNVRSMHQPIAAGKAVDIRCDDQTRTTFLTARIVDANEVRKTRAGLYHGFSVAGEGHAYRPDTVDGRPVTRYTDVDFTEVSLVDRPSNPDAVFTVMKIARREDVSTADKKRAQSEAQNFADTKNKKYKLDSEEQIRAAWSYVNMPKNAGKYSAKDLQTIKDRIIAAWKKKIDKAGPPSAQKKVSKISRASSPAILTKGEAMDDVQEAVIDGATQEAASAAWDSATITEALNIIGHAVAGELNEGETEQAAQLQAARKLLLDWLQDEAGEVDEAIADVNETSGGEDEQEGTADMGEEMLTAEAVPEQTGDEDISEDEAEEEGDTALYAQAIQAATQCVVACMGAAQQSSEMTACAEACQTLMTQAALAKGLLGQLGDDDERYQEAEKNCVEAATACAEACRALAGAEPFAPADACALACSKLVTALTADEAEDASEGAAGGQASAPEEEVTLEKVVSTLLASPLLQQLINTQVNAHMKAQIAKGGTAVTQAFTKLDEVGTRLGALEKRVRGIAKRALVSGPVLHAIPGADEASGVDATISALNETIKDETDPVVRQRLQQRVAKLEMNKVYASGGNRLGSPGS